jgi:hypothetical protein
MHFKFLKDVKDQNIVHKAGEHFEITSIEQIKLNSIVWRSGPGTTGKGTYLNLVIGEDVELIEWSDFLFEQAVKLLKESQSFCPRYLFDEITNFLTTNKM